MVLQVLARETDSQRSQNSSGGTGAGLTPSAYQQPPRGGGMRTSMTALASPAGLPMTVMGNSSSVSRSVVIEPPKRYMQIVAIWQSDCLLCGLSPFDENTLVLLGYPVEEQEELDEEEDFEEGFDGGQGTNWGGRGALFQPEVQLVKRATGEVCCVVGGGGEGGGGSLRGRVTWPRDDNDGFTALIFY